MPGGNDTEQSNADWIVEQIRKARSHMRLRAIQYDIKYDQWEKTDYTQDAAAMERIRNEWGKRRQELRNQPDAGKEDDDFILE